MDIGKTIAKLRCDLELSQEKFANLLGVSRQTVQKWESGVSSPDMENLVGIANKFGISMDLLVLGRDKREMEELRGVKKIEPKYDNITGWDSYSDQLMIEYRQSVDEGLDLEGYENLFRSVCSMPKGAIKEKMANALFELSINAPMRENYTYNEPSELAAIQALRPNAAAVRGKLPADSSGIRAQRLNRSKLGRLIVCIILTHRSVDRQLKQRICHFFLDSAFRHAANRPEQIFISLKVQSFIHRLTVFYHKLVGIRIPTCNIIIFRFDLFDAAKLFHFSFIPSENKQIHGYTEFVCNTNQIFHIRRRYAGLPFLDGLPRNAEQIGKLLLRQFQITAQLCDRFSNIHIPCLHLFSSF